MAFPKYMQKGTKEWHRHRERIEESLKSQRERPAPMFLTGRMMKQMKDRAAQVQRQAQDPSRSDDDSE